MKWRSPERCWNVDAGERCEELEFDVEPEPGARAYAWEEARKGAKKFGLGSGSGGLGGVGYDWEWK